jgi:hypothetical protein
MHKTTPVRGSLPETAFVPCAAQLATRIHHNFRVSRDQGATLSGRPRRSLLWDADHTSLTSAATTSAAVNNVRQCYNPDAVLLIAQLLIACLCAGLGGAVFNWYVNRRFRLPPVLRLRLLRDEGEKGKIKYSSPTQNEIEECFEDARYYHASQNARRWSPANDVQVFRWSFRRAYARPQPGASKGR